jgi:hypothetical protein
VQKGLRRNKIVLEAVLDAVTVEEFLARQYATLPELHVWFRPGRGMTAWVECDVCGTWRPPHQMDAVPPNPLCI